MGGNAFGRSAAARLSHEQYLAMQAYVLPILEKSGHFQGLRLSRYLGDKRKHGDLDVQCGWSEGVVPGQEEWVPANEAPTPLPPNAFPGRKHSKFGPYNASEKVASFAKSVRPTSATSSLDTPNSITIDCGCDNDLLTDNKLRTAVGHIHVMSSKSNTDQRILRDVRDMCAGVMAATGATRWSRHGGLNNFKSRDQSQTMGLGAAVISFKIPTTVLGVEAERFYQLDLVLVPPICLDFISFNTSYSCSAILLGRLVDQLSPILSLHETHLSMRHLVFIGLPPIEIVLTYDPQAFCKWLGLDWARWHQERFETEKDFWAWLTDVERGETSQIDGVATTPLSHEKGVQSLAACALSNAVKNLKNWTYRDPVGRTAKRRAPVDRFYDWLKTESAWAILNTSNGPIECDVNGSTDVGNIPVDTDCIDLALRRLTVGQDKTGLTDQTRTRTAKQNSSTIDPSRPAILDPYAEAAIAHWGVTEEYNRQLKERVDLAERISERQKARERRRANAILAREVGGWGFHETPNTSGPRPHERSPIDLVVNQQDSKVPETYAPEE